MPIYTGTYFTGLLMRLSAVHVHKLLKTVPGSTLRTDIIITFFFSTHECNIALVLSRLTYFMHCFLLFYRNDYMKIFIDWFIADLQYCVSFRSTAKIFSYIYIHIYMCVCVVKVTQLCLTLCDPVDYSQSGSSVHGIFQARILEWVGVPFSGGSSQPRSRTQVSHIAGRFSTA